KKKAAPTKTTKGGKNDVEEEPKKEKGKEFPGALFGISPIKLEQ
ncbi:MAG: hypothetical protein EZS28_041080, partial [Streblomastix strix]